jgi:hypothetical protein
MLKLISVVAAAATVAGTITLFLAPTAMVTAGQLPAAKAAPMQACAQRPWPYLRCVGTPYGTPHVRLVTTDQLPTN